MHNNPMTSALYPLLLHDFANPALLEEALTHPSISNDGNTKKGEGVLNYERLEFLGDAVLGMVIADMLITHYPKETEGDLAKRRAALVCHEALAGVAQSIHLGQYIHMAESEETIGGRENPANLENALEAVIGALYIDGGIAPATHFIRHHWLPLLDTMKSPPKDPKTALQEWSQAKLLGIPEYTMLSAEGPPHAPVFTIQVSLPGITPAVAKGGSKRFAQREAARKLLENVTKKQS